MYIKNRIPGYIVVTRPLEPPTEAFSYETWVFPFPKKQHEEPTIVRYADEATAVEGHVATMARFLSEPEAV